MSKDSETVAEKILANTRTAMFRPERENFLAFIVLWIVVTLIASVPVTVALTASDRIQAHSLGLADDPPAVIAWCVLGLIGTDCAEALPSKSKAAVAIASAQTQFFASLVLYWSIGLALLYSQTRLCVRYWRIANEDRRSGERYDVWALMRPVNWLIVPLIFVSTAVIWGWLESNIEQFPLVVFAKLVALGALLSVATYIQSFDGAARADLSSAPWLYLQFTVVFGGAVALWAASLIGSAQGSLPLSSSTWTLVVAGSIWLLLANTLMTGLATYSYGWDFPSQMASSSVLAGAVDYPHRAAESIDALWSLLETHVKETLKKEGLSDPEAAQERFQPVPCMSGLSAADCDAAVRLLALPLAVVIVLSLVAFGLGANAIAVAQSNGVSTGMSGSDDLPPDMAMLALGMTVSFALILFFPLMRLGPFATVEKAAESPGTKTWTLRAQATVIRAIADKKIEAIAADADDDTAVSLCTIGSKTDEDHASDQRGTPDWQGTKQISLHEVKGAEELHSRVLRRHLGADKSKFQSILASVTNGAAFQQLLGDTVRGKLIAILTLLAPSLTTALIALIK